MYRHPTTFAHLALLLFCLTASTIVFAQRPTDRLGNDINRQYLEHLIKMGVDSVRKKHDCGPLINDSLLFVASRHHAGYMRDKDKLTHTENDRPETKTPGLRVEHFGGTNYSVGENVLVTSYNTRIKSKKGKWKDGFTYGGLANSIVDAWVNSPGHFKNMITPDWVLTGVTVSINPAEQKLYSCQKFGIKNFEYHFTENRTLFPYSDYTPPPPRTGFEDIPRGLLDHKHEWKVRHDKLDRCEHCKSVVSASPGLTVRVKGRWFVLRVENSDFVKQLIRDPKDGFAIEIVHFDDYMCGNPEYYEKPCRRNGQCTLNGRLLEPKYRKDLYRGYRKRKVDREMKFLPYILKADSIPFFKRAYQFKINRFSSDYYEIKLAKKPRDLSGFWNHNLVYLQRKQMCYVSYFTNYCGELFSDTTHPVLLPMDTVQLYDFELDTQQLAFTIPFEKNKAEYSHEDIDPLIGSLANLDFTIDSVNVKAWSSVEGDSTANRKLQETRAKNIVAVLQEHQRQPIQTHVWTYTDWDHLYRSLNRSRQWRHLAKLDRSELLAQLNSGLADSLETILAEERRARIDLFCTIDLTDRNLEYYIKKEWDRHCQELNLARPKEPIVRESLARLHRLFQFAYTQVELGKLDTTVLVNLPIPRYVEANIRFSEKYLLYGYVFPVAFAKNRNWIHARPDFLNVALLEQGKFASPSFLYAYALEMLDSLYHQKKVEQPAIEAIFEGLLRLEKTYQENEFARQNIEMVNFNLHMLLLNNVFSGPANAASAYRSLTEVWSWYNQNGLMNDSLAMQLAKMAVHHESPNLALHILRPFRHLMHVHAWCLPLEYDHVSRPNSARFYQELLRQSEEMPRETWCNLFLDECGIPFQAFDHEELRNVFCEKCQEENKVVRQLLK